MYPITEAVKALFEAEQRKVLRITGTDKNGAAINITDDNVLVDSFQIDRYSCNGEKLEIGTAIAAQLTFTLENGDGTYDGIAFEGTELFVEVGVADWTQTSPTIHWVPCGYFTPDEQPRRMNTIGITALDRMMRFDAVVDGTQITTPITVANLVARVCTLRGVTLAQSVTGLTNANVSLPSIPTGNTVTYRNLIAWCAAILGTNAWFDWNGQLRFSWYNNATGYVSTIDNRYSSDMYENDLTVTGVVYTTAGGIEIVEGIDDYALDLTGNTLASPMITTILPALNTALNGFSYRPFTASAINAPYLWPMDAVTFTDKDGNAHASLMTNVCFGLNGTTAMEARGMTYMQNRQKLPEGFTKEQAQLINEVSNKVKDDIDNALTQQEIFNRLTDNGAAQGLVLYDGQLYINASYIQSGTLTLGGVNNQNGTLVVRDASGNVVGNMSNVGFSFQGGNSRYGLFIDPGGNIALGEKPDNLSLFDTKAFIQLMAGGIAKVGNLYFGSGEQGVQGMIGPMDGGGLFFSGPGGASAFIAKLTADEADIFSENTRLEGDLRVVGQARLNHPLGTLYGGIGVSLALPPSLLVDLDSNTAANVFQLSPRPGVTGTLGIANGGTNASSADGARSNLDVPSRSGSGASGTWGISISGNAATATRATQDGSGNNIGNTYLKMNTAGGIASCSGGGSNWYFKVATVKITSGYTNYPIVFEISGRGRGLTWVQLYFESTSSSDPALGSFTTNNWPDFWVKKTATSTWEVYGKYNETWGQATLHRITGCGANIGVTVNMVNIGTTEPSGATKARYSGNVGYADNAYNVAGTVAVGHGGTGATTKAGAREGIGIRFKDVFIPSGGTEVNTGLTVSSYEIIALTHTNPLSAVCPIKGAHPYNGVWWVYSDTVQVGTASVRVLYVEK